MDPARPGEEIIVLAMAAGQWREKDEVREAMKELAGKMLRHGPHAWISHNFLELDIPQIASRRSLLRLLRVVRPQAAREILFRAVAERSSVITALYTKEEKVIALLEDLQSSWVPGNRRKGYPISIVLSGLFEDVRKCCSQSSLRPHTYLHSLGLWGQVDRAPAGGELELVGMCGHGLLAHNRIRQLVEKIAKREISAQQAAEDVARPCVCGIVNRQRAERIFRILARNEIKRLTSDPRSSHGDDEPGGQDKEDSARRDRPWPT